MRLVRFEGQWALYVGVEEEEKGSNGKGSEVLSKESKGPHSFKLRFLELELGRSFPQVFQGSAGLCCSPQRRGKWSIFRRHNGCQATLRQEQPDESRPIHAHIDHTHLLTAHSCAPNATNMINAFLVFNGQGQPRLTKFYTQLVIQLPTPMLGAKEEKIH